MPRLYLGAKSIQKDFRVKGRSQVVQIEWYYFGPFLVKRAPEASESQQTTWKLLFNLFLQRLEYQSKIIQLHEMKISNSYPLLADLCSLLVRVASAVPNTFHNVTHCFDQNAIGFISESFLQNTTIF